MLPLHQLLFLLLLGTQLNAQTPSTAYLALQPYEVNGNNNPFKLNISFGAYKTQHISRSLGSVFNFGSFSVEDILLDMAGMPLLTGDRHRAKDVFSFDLKQEGQVISSARCRAILRQNEKVRLLSPSDSSFFSLNNVDFLQAVIALNNDSSQVWQMAASNLNGSMNEPQKGLLRHDTTVISFEKTTMLLREKAVDRSDISSLLATLNLVYCFTYRNQVVAAVSYKEADKRVWLHEKLDPQLARVIANAAMVLTLRRQLYQ